ncbi:MAG TPA: hypothetical protein PKA88_11860 [Polyangiaceae bacterium]|nr:hypothetical protein [Polyangiaceae bacterium]HMR79380.1 hypothetical protein [Polyangiaceae bacterium]
MPKANRRKRTACIITVGAVAALALSWQPGGAAAGERGEQSAGTAGGPGGLDPRFLPAPSNEREYSGSGAVLLGTGQLAADQEDNGPQDGFGTGGKEAK